MGTHEVICFQILKGLEGSNSSFSASGSAMSEIVSRSSAEFVIGVDQGIASIAVLRGNLPSSLHYRTDSVDGDTERQPEVVGKGAIFEPVRCPDILLRGFSGP